jgi:hypothetical protein
MGTIFTVWYIFATHRLAHYCDTSWACQKIWLILFCPFNNCEWKIPTPPPDCADTLQNNTFVSQRDIKNIYVFH